MLIYSSRNKECKPFIEPRGGILKRDDSKRIKGGKSITELTMIGALLQLILQPELLKKRLIGDSDTSTLLLKIMPVDSACVF